MERNRHFMMNCVIWQLFLNIDKMGILNTSLMVWFLLFAHSVYGQRTLPLSKGPEHSNFYEEIPYDFVKNKIIISAIIDGIERKFILDTGAPVVLSKELAKDIQPDTIRQLMVSDADGKENPLYLGKVRSLLLGNVPFREVSALLADTSNFIFDCFGVDGFIGTNIFNNCILHFDSKRKVIVLTDDVNRLQLSKANRSKIKLKGSQHTPVVVVKPAGKVKHEVIFDSGDGNLYDISTQDFEKISIMEKTVFSVHEKGFGNSSLSLYGEGESIFRYRYKIPFLEMNGVKLKEVVGSTHGGSDSRLGAALLKYGNVTIDFRKKHFYFTPHENTPEEVLEEENWYVFTPVVSGGKLRVGTIWNNWDVPYSIGDEIVFIDGHMISDKDPCALLLMGTGTTVKNGSHVIIRKPSGQEVAITM